MPSSERIDAALAALEENAHRETKGRWLEDLVADVAPHIREWNVDGCWRWPDWPDRDTVMPPGTPASDDGIDLVARRRDGKWIAIQSKSRKLNPEGEGSPVLSGELDKFLSASSNRTIWAERWLVVNGSVPLGGHAPNKIRMSGFPMNVVNVAQDVEAQHTALTTATEGDPPCPHCEADTYDPTLDAGPVTQTRSCMQREAVRATVERLRANEQVEEENIPRGEARGRIVLPCGTGKTRIALRITEQLTYPGELSVVLCPSIALVAQIRREFLQHAAAPMRVMAVCSDKGVAADEEKVANAADATVDRGLVTTEEIKGCPVTTDVDEIADWIRQRRNGASGAFASLIFGTYQSAQRIAAAIKAADAADGFKVLICDEAHRTAGVRRRRRSTAAEDRLREFTLCHDRDAFPATYRVYQTATPRIFGDAATARVSNRPNFVIRQMDDQAIFGVELYRRSYADAVRNEWLSDYRIIAMAVGGQKATAIANELVREADEAAAAEAEAAAARGQKAKTRGRRAARLPNTGDYLKGMAFALAMGGAARTASGQRVPLRSCIGFLNTIARSKAMASVLQSEAVREWVADQAGAAAPLYRLEHLDASAPVSKRDEAKRRLATADDSAPHGVLNVGIFGEGTDSPSLSAVAFLEPRRSPIDVVQAVGRAMRRAEGKELGYIVVPVVIPPGVDAERHLAMSDKHEGWRELGDILQALRAHDQRIEDALPEMLTIQLPPEPQQELPLRTAVAVGRPDKTRLEYAVVTGSREMAEDTARAAVKHNRPLLDYDNTEPFDERLWQELQDEPTSLIVHTERPDGSTVTREDSVVRHKPKANQQQGKVNERQTKRRAGQVSNGERGRELPDPAERARKRAEREAERQAMFEEHVQGVLLDLSKDLGGAIAMNLLEKSGLTGNKVQRDLNLLADAVNEAARHIHEEQGLAAVLDSHFLLDDLAPPKKGKPRADGATIAALLWMNAAMLHQRVHAGGWLRSKGIRALSEVKSLPNPEAALTRSWNAITRQDFVPVIDPAIEALDVAVETGRLGGLRRALRHLVAEAEQIAETYADMGTDHAGALFNQVMGDQASDGAYFTRPVAATIAARLAFDAADPDNALDWSQPDVWRQHKTIDMACGSGTLLTAAMTEMKRRAITHGADQDSLAALQKLAVENTLKGLDINEVSLQLAATQLMSGNADVKYRWMGLHRMPYGPQPDGSVAAGTLELFGRQDIVNAGRLFDDAADSVTVKTGAERRLEGHEMDTAVEAVADARIVIMNPPFTNRNKMGQKYPEADQKALRHRLDTLEGFLRDGDPGLSEFLDRDKNSLRPRFAALADLCLNRDDGVFATVLPTIALTGPSGLLERVELARRFHIHTILTYMGAIDVNLSQSTHREMNESVVVMRRHDNAHAPPTRIVSIDRFPTDDTDTGHLFTTLEAAGTKGVLADGWGEVSEWPADRIRAGDWTAAVWRSPQLAEAAVRYAEHPDLRPLTSAGLSAHATGRQLRGGYRPSTAGDARAFPILKAKSEDAQTSIEGTPDQHWAWKRPGDPPILDKQGHLLITAGQNTSAARLTAVASGDAYVGNGWMPVTGADVRQAQAAAVYLNSTVGRLLLIRHPGSSLKFPTYSVAAANRLPIPDLNDPLIVSPLAACWETTRSETVPQFRDGYTDIRRRWDIAVCDTLGWDIDQVTELGELLAKEPNVRGVAYGQWKP